MSGYNDGTGPQGSTNLDSPVLPFTIALHRRMSPVSDLLPRNSRAWLLQNDIATVERSTRTQTRQGARLYGLIAVFAVIMMDAALSPAQANFAERFAATTMNFKSHELLKIDVARWSTDADRDRINEALAKGDNEFLKALGAAPTVAYIWPPGALGYSLHYACHVTMPDGGERVVLASDRRLGTWDPESWTLNPSILATPYQFTVIELRVGHGGRGEGKMSLAANVSVDQGSKTIGLDNYNSAPILLTNVRREGAAPSAKSVSK